MRKFQSSFLFPSPDEEDESHHAYPGLFVTQFLIPFGALVLAGLQFFVGEKLPVWMHWTVMLCLVVIAGSALIRPTKKAFRWLARRYRYRRAAGTFLAELESNVKTFIELTAEDRASSLVCVMKEINNWEEFRLKPVSLSGMAFLRHSLESLVRRLEMRRRAEFSLLAWDFSELVMEYQRFCRQAHQHLDTSTTWSIPDSQRKHLRTQWNLAREALNHFMKSWEQTAKKINDQTEDRVCIAYYEPLKPLD